MIHDISFEKYLASPAISRSKLSALLDSKWHFSAKKAPTSAMTIGTYIHERLLTPEINTFEVEPNVNKRTKAGREEIELFNERLKASNKMAISPDDKMNADLACKMAKEHPAADLLLSESEYNEATVFHSHDGIDLKARFDLLNANRGWIADVKKTRDASPKAFARDAVKYRYHFQAAFYTWIASQALGIPINTFYIIAIEDKEPYGVAVYQLSKEFVERGELLMEQAFDKLHNYDILPRVYSDEIVELNLPWS
jgi:hypothetical protein